MTARTHGSTFGGNPLAMSIANVVLDHILKKDFLQHVIDIGNYLKEQLDVKIKKIFPSLIEEIRGKGLMIGIKPKISNDIIIVEMMRSEKVLAVKASENIIRLLPPLILQKNHVDEAIDKISRALSKI